VDNDYGRQSAESTPVNAYKERNCGIFSTYVLFFANLARFLYSKPRKPELALAF
jgi:hypothetical protein